MINNYLKTVVLSIFFLSSIVSYAQTDAQKERITSRYNSSLLNQLATQFMLESKAQSEALIDEARRRNLELSLTLENGSYAELQRFEADGTPIYYQTYNVDAAKSTRADHLNIGGSTGFNLDGQDMIAYVWDGGHARASHQEYKDFSGNTRVTVMDADSEGLDLNFHAGHVTGTIIATGVEPRAKGMAPQSKALSYKWNSDLAEAAQAVEEGMLVSNHSYGPRSDLLPDYFFGAYVNSSRNWDNLLYNAPYYTMFVAAGNDGTTTYNGEPIDPDNPEYDKLAGNATSKNNVVVANARDANVDDNGELISVLINSGSSQGPTDDLRIKPDIAGNGTGVYSTYADGDASYASISGTSMASPNVAGSALLLQQHSQKLFGEYMRSATLKGLILHTADDAGMEGPDAIFGWGLMNSKRAAEALSGKDNGVVINDLSLMPDETYTLEVESNDVDALLASISWTDPAGEASTDLNSDTPRLVNDLDIVVEQNGTEYFPWRLTGVNTNEKGNNSVDNFERVDIDDASGTYTITVSHKGELTNNQQNFTLIVTGLVAEPVVCEAVPPTGITLGGVDFDSASLYWDNAPGGEYIFRYREEGTEEWIEVAQESNVINLENLIELTTYEVQISTVCVAEETESEYSETFTFTTKEFILSYCNSNGSNTSDEYIGRVRLHQIDNESGASSGYTDFTEISTELVVGESYTVTINPVWTGTVYSEGISVWIDFNLNGDFTDEGEQVLISEPSTSDEVSATFTVPEGAVEGEELRMRVSLKYNGLPTSCESFQYGEVEDYTVVLLPVGSCSVLMPEGEDEQYFCTEPTLADVDVEPSEDIVWYNQETEGEVLASDYQVSDGETFYAARVDGDCESTDRLAVTVFIGDIEGPTPTQVVLENVEAQCEVTELESPTAEDNCDDATIVGVSSVEFPITETTVVTWEFIDSSGNVTTQTQNVVIEDTENPVPSVEALNDIEALCEVTELVEPTAEDNCEGTITGTTSVEFPITETTEITWEFEDSSGNVTTQTQNIVIEDTESPEIVLNEEIVIELDEDGLATLTIEDVDNGSVDNCGIASQVLSQVDFTCDDYDEETETVEVTYTVTDNSGNVSEETFEITLLDPFNKCTLSSSVFENSDVSVYPNPVKQILNLDLGTSQVSVDKVTIYDIRGKELMTMNLDSNKNSIDVSSLSSGNYFLMMSSGKDTLVKRFIKE